MNKILPIFVIGILVISGLGAVAIPNSEQKTLFKTESVSLSEPVFEKNGEYLSVYMGKGVPTLLRTGRPMIPFVTKVFTFPIGTKISSVDVSIELEKYILEKKIQPSPQPVPLSDKLASKILSEGLIVNEDVYSSSDLYPSKPYTVQKYAGLKGGEHVLYLNVRCYSRYSPANDVIYIPEAIDIEVEYELPESPIFAADEYDMLIITDEIFASQLQPLVDHKNNIGIKTVLETVQNIYPAYDGRDDAEDIKLCIKDAIEEWGIQYVLLAGGIKGQTSDWYVASRRSNNGGSNWESGYESDLYFSDIYKIVENETVFEDWDSNGNNVFAEYGMFSKDIIDGCPDVSVGRIPFRYTSEVDIVVNKIIDYENNADDSWFKKAIVIAGDTFPGGEDHVYEGEVETGVTANLLESIGFGIEKLWLSIGAWTGPEDVVDAISAGAGFVHFAGHGNPASWASHLPEDDVFIDGLQLRDMKKLKNDGKLPVIVVGGCHNAQFNVTMSNVIKGIKKYGIIGMFFDEPYEFYHMDWVPRDFCSWLVMQEGGGAIASIGNAGLGYGRVGEYGDLDGDGITEPDTIEALGGWIEPRFFDAYVNQGIHILGEAHDQAIIDYINIIGNSDIVGDDDDDVNDDATGRQTIEEWTLIGDPSLKLGGV